MKHLVLWPLRAFGALFWMLFMLSSAVVFTVLIGAARLLLGALRYLTKAKP